MYTNTLGFIESVSTENATVDTFYAFWYPKYSVNIPMYIVCNLLSLIFNFLPLSDKQISFHDL